MKRVRLVSLAIAILVTAMQWAVFFSPVFYTQPARALDAAVADDVLDGELPVIVVSGHRQS